MMIDPASASTFILILNAPEVHLVLSSDASRFLVDSSAVRVALREASGACFAPNTSP